MQFIDSHSHIYSEEFKEDLPQVIQRAREAGVSHIFLPNIDSTSVDDMLATCREYKGYCFPMMGLHPTSVNEHYNEELQVVEQYLKAPNRFVAIGEVGMDLYWDRTFAKEQEQVLKVQADWAMEYHLPLVLHCRNAYREMFSVLAPYQKTSLRGIFHSFTGTPDELEEALQYENFLFGVNGIVTFKKSSVPALLKHIPLERLVLETDAPYLAPVPVRGKRNESAYLLHTLNKVAEVYGIPPEAVASVTRKNTLKLFGMEE